MRSYALRFLLGFKLLYLLGLFHKLSVEVHVITFYVFHTLKMLSVISYLKKISMLLIAVIEVLYMDKINGLILVVCMIDRKILNAVLVYPPVKQSAELIIFDLVICMVLSDLRNETLRRISSAQVSLFKVHCDVSDLTLILDRTDNKIVDTV